MSQLVAVFSLSSLGGVGFGRRSLYLANETSPSASGVYASCTWFSQARRLCLSPEAPLMVVP
jgi:hypothetical protein